ncbi:MAG: hypothetical protein IPN23_02865 [Elusimicrobia bacterium]|nr:hypothetical protein [Elusimicrobiota bacterium]
MRIVLGVTGASGSIFAVEFLRRVSGEEIYLVLSRWGRSVLHQETGLTSENLTARSLKSVFQRRHERAPGIGLRTPSTSCWFCLVP